MKSSPSYSKALFLSLSVIVLVGSGCDRRGRAPIASVNAAPSDANVAATPTSTTPLTPSSTTAVPTTVPTTMTIPPTTRPVATQSEAQYLDAADMKCDAPGIDEKGPVSKNQFVADLAAENTYQACMNKAGLVLNLADKDASRIWTLDSSPKPAENSSAFKEFSRLADSGLDDGKIEIIMSARLELSILRLGKMLTKYSDDKLSAAGINKTDTMTSLSGKTFVVSTVLSDISKSVSALEAARADIAAMKTVSNGTDLTRSEDLRNQSHQK